MDLTRRRFVTLCGASAAAFGVGGCELLTNPVRDPALEDLIADPALKKELANIALEVCRRRNATFADVRIVRSVGQTLVAHNNAIVPHGEWHYGVWPLRVGEKYDYGFNVRVLKNGAWGFAASPVIESDEFAAIANVACDLAEQSARTVHEPITLVPEPPHEDTYVTPYEEDPFTVSLDEKAGLLLEINDRLLAKQRIDRAISWLDFWDHDKYYANSDGSSIQQRIVRSDGSFFARASANGVQAQRRFFLNPLNIGYEHIRGARLAEHTDRVAEEAIEKAMAPRYTTETELDVIMDPQNICLLQHETIAHPTELNRTLLTETNFAGSTFLGPEDVGTYQFGSKVMNVVADRSRPTLRSTCRYDDEGVETQEWQIVKDGVLVGFQTTREYARFVGENRSRGCCLSSDWDRQPFLRIPNLHLEAGPEGSPTPEELIADTEHGLLFSGFATRIVQDFQRRFHTYTANAIWEIRNGKRVRMVRDAHYFGANPSEIWHRLEAVTNQGSWEPAALDSDGVGEPSQRNMNTHGAPWARFRKMKVGGPTV